MSSSDFPAGVVVVEGSLMPCAGVLERGERRRVMVTDEVRGWVEAGCLTVVAGVLDV